MCEIDREQELLAALKALDLLKSRGLTVETGTPCGVVIMYSGHVRGIWHFDRGLFRYTPAGYAVPRYQAATIEEAVAITQAVV
jgi:hypothetical protein